VNERRIEPDRLTLMLNDPVVIKIAIVLDIVSLSILELLEYGISRKDVSHALAIEIIMFDKSALVYNDMSSNFLLTEQDIIASGDYYFYNFLNSKVKLTELGLYILETLKGEKLKTNIPPDKPDTFQDYSSLGNIRPN
jgi:hypothetical protein